ncbi:MAG: glycosyltransferase family 4 protein [Flectobacillus sp.]|nr:glycosyltransferase family 4 protein [Flectobacillus sp.]
MKKIYFITPQFKTGGGNRVFVELANCLVETQDITIVFPNNSPDRNTFNLNEGVKVMCLGELAKKPWMKILNLLKVFHYLNKYCRKDYVIITDPIMSLLGFLISAPQRYRFVQADDYRIFDDRLIVKNYINLLFYKLLTRISYHYHFTYIFNSEYTKKRFRDLLVFKGERYDGNKNIVHPAINHKIFKSLKYSCNSKESMIKVCLVARKHPWKGLDTFIEAFNYLPKEITAKLEVILVSHDDLESFNLPMSFTKVNPRSDEDIAVVYQSSEIFISTSWWEGFGLPPLEAMACGCAVICSQSGGVDEYAVDDYNCLMFEPKDSISLAKKIEILVSNKQLRYNLAVKGIETAQKFSWDISSDNLLQILSK